MLSDLKFAAYYLPVFCFVNFSLEFFHRHIFIAGRLIPYRDVYKRQCVFLEIGQDVHIAGGDLTEAVNEGVRRGYTNGYLRKSVVKDPVRRGNTGDNTDVYKRQLMDCLVTISLVPV